MSQGIYWKWEFEVLDLTVISSPTKVLSLSSKQSYMMAKVWCLTHEELQRHLEDLCINFLTLSRYLPTVEGSDTIYQFQGYKPTQESIDEEGALNWELEITFCPQERHNPIVLKETGPSLEAVVDVLDKWTEKFPKSMVLQECVNDLITATEQVTTMRSKFAITVSNTHHWLGSWFHPLKGLEICFKALQ